MEGGCATKNQKYLKVGHLKVIAIGVSHLPHLPKRKYTKK
jgi:hypothetical protein